MARVDATNSRKRIMVSLFVIIIFQFAATSGIYGFSGEVISVDSGDTLVAIIADEKRNIRLYGIDAPENGQHGSNAARRYLRTLALSHPIEVEVIETDVFGRTLAIVRRVEKESSLNAAVVANGHAWVNPKICMADVCDRWKGLQDQAKKYRLGIWSGFDLIPPWEFDTQQGR